MKKAILFVLVLAAAALYWESWREREWTVYQFERVQPGGNYNAPGRMRTTLRYSRKPCREMTWFGTPRDYEYGVKLVDAKFIAD